MEYRPVIRVTGLVNDERTMMEMKKGGLYTGKKAVAANPKDVDFGRCMTTCRCLVFHRVLLDLITCKPS